MKIHSKVVLAGAVLCGVFFTEHSAQAVILDLTTKNTEVRVTPVHGTALFSTNSTRAAGHGDLDPLSRTHSEGDVEGGLTKDIRLSDLAVLDGNYAFVVDVRETNPASSPAALVTLDALQVSASKEDGTGQADSASLIPITAFAGAKSSDFMVPHTEYGNNRSSDFGVSAAPRHDPSSVARIIIIIPEVTSILPLTGILGLALGARHLRRPRRSAQA